MGDPHRGTEDDDLMPIGRFARLAGLSIGALRHYDVHGLLSPARVDAATGYRSYRLDQVETARLIRRLREVELPLPEIRRVLGADAVERERLLATHRSRMEARTVRLQRIVHQLSQEVPMSPSAPALLDADTHRALGVDLFNHVWTLLEAEDRTPEQDTEMMHAAHASVLHWTKSAPPDLRQRQAIGEWQCSRVYATLGRGEPALWHANRCRDIAEGGTLDDWVVAASYEAMARASRVAGDAEGAAAWRARAETATAAIADPAERQVIEGDLATLGVLDPA
jgi:DNA-binding transcriptional MerR regulator